MDIKFGNRTIGLNHPTYFIADIAANHDGDLERAKLLIRLAKEAGADAAKFQNFDAPNTPAEATESNWQVTKDRLGQSQRLVRESIGDLTLSDERVPYLIAHDSYHLGQIMQLRAMQGLRPIE